MSALIEYKVSVTQGGEEVFSKIMYDSENFTYEASGESIQEFYVNKIVEATNEGKTAINLFNRVFLLNGDLPHVCIEFISKQRIT